MNLPEQAPSYGKPLKRKALIRRFADTLSLSPTPCLMKLSAGLTPKVSFLKGKFEEGVEYLHFLVLQSWKTC